MKTTTTIENLIAHIVSECSAVNTDTRYDEMIDECYSFESAGGIFSSMSPSRVLRECDPVVYRCGKNDWLDGERDTLTEVDDNYYDTREVEKTKEEFISELESEVSAMEEEIKELEAEEFSKDEENNDVRVLELDIRLNTLRTNLAEVEKYSF